VLQSFCIAKYTKTNVPYGLTTAAATEEEE
jgi:hypothetical protein